MRVVVPAPEQKSFAHDAFVVRAELLRDPSTGDVLDRHDDLDPGQIEIVESVSREQTGSPGRVRRDRRLRCEPSTQGWRDGSRRPVVDPARADDRAPRIEDHERRLTGSELAPAPCQRLWFAVVGRGPRHPGRHSGSDARTAAASGDASSSTGGRMVTTPSDRPTRRSCHVRGRTPQRPRRVRVVDRSGPAPTP